MSLEMFHGHAINRIQDIQFLNFWWGDNTSNEMQKLHTNKSFIDNYFSLKYSNSLSYFFVS